MSCGWDRSSPIDWRTGRGSKARPQGRALEGFRWGRSGTGLHRRLALIRSAAAELVARQDAVSIRILLIEAPVRPGPFVQGNPAVVVHIEAREVVLRRVGVVELRPRQFLIPVRVEPLERVGASVPLVALDRPVPVHVQVVETRIVLDVLVIVSRLPPAHAVDADLVTRQHAVVVPIEVLERPRIAPPFIAADLAVVVRVHPAEPHAVVRRIPTDVVPAVGRTEVRPNRSGNPPVTVRAGTACGPPVPAIRCPTAAGAPATWPRRGPPREPSLRC